MSFLIHLLIANNIKFKIMDIMNKEEKILVSIKNSENDFLNFKKINIYDSFFKNI